MNRSHIAALALCFISTGAAYADDKPQTPEEPQTLSHLAELNEMELLLKKQITIARLRKELEAAENGSPAAPPSAPSRQNWQVYMIAGQNGVMSAKLRADGGVKLTVQAGDEVPFNGSENALVQSISDAGVRVILPASQQTHDLPLAVHP